MVNSKLKPVFDYLPLVVFFVCFKWLGLQAATAALVAVTLVIVATLFVLERRVAMVPLVTAGIVTLFGGLSLWFNNDMFIKMKPTVINLLFAAILMGGCLRGKGLLSYIMGPALNLTEQGWWILSFRFGLFFASMALLNEIIWRTMPTEWWVNFKVFGIMALTFAFALLHAGFIQRFQKQEMQNNITET